MGYSVGAGPIHSRVRQERERERVYKIMSALYGAHERGAPRISPRLQKNITRARIYTHTALLRMPARVFQLMSLQLSLTTHIHRIAPLFPQLRGARYIVAARPIIHFYNVFAEYILLSSWLYIHTHSTLTQVLYVHSSTLYTALCGLNYKT